MFGLYNELFLSVNVTMVPEPNFAFKQKLITF